MKSSLFLTIAIFPLLFGTSIASFWNWQTLPKPWNWWKTEVSRTRWDNLQVTFGKFDSLPKSSKDAEDAGWTKTASCNGQSYFRGHRYVKNDDNSTMVLYDCNGDFAGIQFAIAKSLATHPSFEMSHWNEEGDFLVITAYFVLPSAICNKGLRQQFTDNLYIQTGPSPANLMSIPYMESDLGSTLWVKGKCFIFMGQHYWYNVSEHMSCDNSFPVFLLYHGGKLNGFGWAMIADVITTRVEHPTPPEFSYFFEKTTQPKCLDTVGTLTTQHVYLKKYPRLIFCNPFKKLMKKVKQKISMIG